MAVRLEEVDQVVPGAVGSLPADDVLPKNTNGGSNAGNGNNTGNGGSGNTKNTDRADSSLSQIEVLPMPPRKLGISVRLIEEWRGSTDQAWGGWVPGLRRAPGVGGPRSSDMCADGAPRKRARRGRD